MHRLARGRAHVELVDVDRDPALGSRYGVRVPVVAVDGQEVAELQLDPARLRAALDARLDALVPSSLTRQAALIAMALHAALAIVPFWTLRHLTPGWLLPFVYASWSFLAVTGMRVRRDQPALSLLAPVCALAIWLVVVALAGATWR